jgi:hypothetical protein
MHHSCVSCAYAAAATGRSTLGIILQNYIRPSSDALAHIIHQRENYIKPSNNERPMRKNGTMGSLAFVPIQLQEQLKETLAVMLPRGYVSSSIGSELHRVNSSQSCSDRQGSLSYRSPTNAALSLPRALGTKLEAASM